MPLTPSQRKSLKARAHALQPVVMIGGNGLTPPVLKEIDRSLAAHELIKVQVSGEDRESRGLMLEEICSAVGAEAVQTIGRMLVLYREAPQDSADKAARTAKPRGPRATKRSFQGSR